MRRARRAELSGATHDPIVWTHATGVNVFDADDNRYVDMTAGFGVAAIGHTHPRVVAAIATQSSKLLHALGDVQPADTKIALLRELAKLAPVAGARVILGLSGSDAVEAALKTAVLHTKRSGVIAFEGGYHGLAHGPLGACGYSEAFRAPFADQLNPHVLFAPYPGEHDDVRDSISQISTLVAKADARSIGAILVEPIQSRGGVRVPPQNFLPALVEYAHANGMLLVADEIYVGLGRTGEPLTLGADLWCIGKSLGGGMPVSACIGSNEVMTSWGAPDHEALHTGTFFGNPVACAAALETLAELRDARLSERATRVGVLLTHALTKALSGKKAFREVRGRGLLLGVRLESDVIALRCVRLLLEAGYITLPAGSPPDVVSLTPPLTLPESLIDGFATAFAESLDAATF